MFVNGAAGTGKTFLTCACCNCARSRQKIVLATATSAFAAQLYPGGRTTHATFKVSIPLLTYTLHLTCSQVLVNECNQFLESPVRTDDTRGELLRNASLIIWDEAPMANKAVLACVDVTLRKVTNCNEPFGGKVILLLGDFCQMCPVIPGGSKTDVLDASIRSSPLWDIFHIWKLTTPVRNAEDPCYQRFVDDIGVGLSPTVSLATFHIVYEESHLIDYIFPAEILLTPDHCSLQSILTPTNRQIDVYNTAILDHLTGPQHIYFAADTVKNVDSDMACPTSLLNYVKKQTPPGLPPYVLPIKVGGVYRLLRNLSLSRNMVKNARVVVTQVGDRVLSVCLLGKGNANISSDHSEVLLPRITFTATMPSTNHTVLRKQFPLAAAYATIFNSCQGLTLERVAIDLTRAVFTHGQLYTAFSRVRHREDACIRCTPCQSLCPNIVFKELLL